jgi:Domain of unknown function (DUF4604)
MILTGPGISHLITSMAPKEPTKHQLSARLTYSQHTPAFLRKLQSRISGFPDEDSDESPEFEDDGSGRPPIPRRPPIPERPPSDPGSAEEDRDDEAPQVVVLKEGKHLSSREVENEKRKGKFEGQQLARTSQGFSNSIIFPLLPLPSFLSKQRACSHCMIHRKRRRAMRKSPKRRNRMPRRKQASRFPPLLPGRLPSPDQ